MKKILILLLVMIFMSGCVPIKDMQLEEVVNNALSSKYKLYNTVNQGFKFYLPRGLKTVIQDELNVIIKSKYYDYYLFVDLVSYYNKIEIDYIQKKHVKKPSGAKPGFVVYYTNYSLMIDSDISGIELISS